MPTRHLCLLLLLVPLAGCGSSGRSDTDAVERALERFDAAQASGDGREACRSLIAIDERGTIEVPGLETARQRELGSSDEEAAFALDCERAFTTATASRRALKDVQQEVGRIEVDGDDATAVIDVRFTREDGTTLRRETTRRLVKRNGSWRVVLTGE